jgi:uncharacterized membrane protein (GlpM family)
MLQYLIYFLIGGTVVAAVAYLGSRGDSALAALVASLPVLFLLNVFVMYRAGGMNGSLTYAKGVVLMLPVFVFYAALTIWLLPRLGMPKALILGLPVYLIPVVAIRMRRHKTSKAKAIPSSSSEEVTR